MERTITGTVGEVKGRTVNTKYGEKTVFDITIGSQKVSTFKSGIAEEANALRGSDVEATVREEQKGDYTNYMLLGVKLVDALGTGNSSNGTSTSTIPVSTAPEKKGWQPEDTARVTRLSCLSTAFTYAGQMGDSPEAALSLAERLYGVAMGTESPEPVEALTGAPESNDGIAW